MTSPMAGTGFREAGSEGARVAQRIGRPRLWQYDYLMLREIADGLGRVAASLNGSRNLEILDVGCKHSPYRELFAERASRYVGLDREDYSGVHVRGDATSLPFRSESFDLVLCTQAFYLIPSFREALTEFARVTRAGGRIVLTTIGIWPYPPSQRLHRWSRRELQEALEEFGEVRVEETGGYLKLVPQLANAAVAMGVEGHLRKSYPRAGKALVLPLKGLYAGVNVLGLAMDGAVRAAARTGWGVARSLQDLDDHLAINYLAVVTPRK